MFPASLRFFLLSLMLLVVERGFAFTSNVNNGLAACTASCRGVRSAAVASPTQLYMAQITEKEAKVNIDKVVAALRKDKEANSELGRLQSVNNILGFGSPVAGQIAVRFNASFKKGGMGRAAIPLPFGLGQTNESEGRGVMVGQVKASVDANTGKVVSCSVFRDLGYGRAFNLKV